MSLPTAAATEGTLQPAWLWSQLRQLAGPAGASQRQLHCAVAWSGGLDSTVLLHLMLSLRAAHPRQLRLRALHVDHHLQPAAAAFRAHCIRIARRWRVPLTLLDAQVLVTRGGSVEEAAREARHACWRGALQAGELLLTAQHADDQLETTLLALLRGAGPAGLAAMPSDLPMGRGRLLRPLLTLPRAGLLQYASAQQLPVIEDPTNAETRFDRNFLRLKVLPQLRQRWPGASATVSRSARHSARAAALQAAAGTADLEQAADGAGLELAVLRRWPEHRVLNALRAWFSRAGMRSPETRHLQQILGMLSARGDAHPRLDLPQACVRVHAGRLLLQLRAASAPQPRKAINWSWRRGPLRLPDGGTLAVLPDLNGDLDLAALPARLQVRFLGARPPGRSLRKLLQELEVPQWDRGRLPLLFGSGSGGAPLAIADLWLTRAVQQQVSSLRRGRIVWQVAR